MKKFAGLLVSGAILLSCDILDPDCRDQPDDQANRVSIRQGVWGQTWFWRGDFTPRGTCPPGTIAPVQRVVYFFQPTLLSQVEYAQPPYVGPMFRAVRTEVVDSVRSDRRGFFQIELPPGTYSVFVREDSFYYANSFSPQGAETLIQSITVAANRVSKLQINIDHQAVQ